MYKILVYFILFASTIFAQKNYYVSKDGSGDFNSISTVNSAELQPGDKVSFKSGDQFSDATLVCQEGVTYNTFSGSIKAIIGDSASASFSRTVYVPNDNVTLTNLKLAGYKNADYVVLYKSQHMTIENCIVVGGENSHSYKTIGIGEENSASVYNYGHKIIRNKIHNLATGIDLSRPYNYEIAYNKMYDFWREDGKMDHGGRAIARNSISQEEDHLETFDSKYTFHIHHNEIYNFEYVALHVGFSRMLIEYNELHSPLDERIYRGGVKHGSIGKIYDKTHMKLGALGIIFRYNYVHDFIRKGEPGYTYGTQTPAKVRSGTYDIISTNNGLDRAVYENSGSLSYVPHFGDDEGEGPDNLISGLGYGNFWIHNNIMYNITNKMTGRSFTRTKDYNTGEIDIFRADLPTYYVNNTLLNVGTGYVAKDHLIITESTSQSPHVMVNNIIDYNNSYARSLGRFKEKELTLSNNIFIKQNGIVIELPYQGAQKATYFQNDGQNYSLLENNKHATDPGWVNKTSFIFAPNIGPEGTWIPDVRIIEGGNAHNGGMDYNKIGDNYTDSYGTHELGKDPTGRSFAYDIFGNLRSTNDIGAVGSAPGGPIITPNSGSTTPTINSQPTNTTVNLGDNITFTVSASSNEQIGYQWWKFPYVNDSESRIINNEKYSGATSNSLTIKDVSAADADVKYLCEVYNKQDHSNLWVNSSPASILLNLNQGFPEGENLKVFLEAPYFNGQLNNTINSANFFPIKQPYNNSPWNLESNVELTEIKTNYVDWVIIELRKELGQISYRKAGIITAKGNIVNSDDSKLSFNNISPGEYYISIKHRNHLGIMSAHKININNNEPVLYDFTRTQTSAYGNNPMTDLGDGVYGMFAGDADANGVVNNLDFGKVANAIPFKGYSVNDLDMNGTVNVLDYNKINKNILKSTQIPK